MHVVGNFMFFQMGNKHIFARSCNLGDISPTLGDKLKKLRKFRRFLSTESYPGCTRSQT